MNYLNRIAKVVKKYGIRYTVTRLINKISEGKLVGFYKHNHLFKGKNGIEIGGPSEVFRKMSYIPIYDLVAELDGLNFAQQTIWEGNIEDGKNYKFSNRVGYQFISEASDLSKFESEKYDFLISSNCLEHVANPLKALLEWKRVIKPGGAMLVLLPNQINGIDKFRPITIFEHLLHDYKENVSENDLTHLDEILQMHDLKHDRDAGTFEEFKKRSLDNFSNRTLHHHVFDIDLLTKIFDYLELDIKLKDDKYGFVTMLGQKRCLASK